MKCIFISLSRSKRYVVAELFLVYFAQGLSSIMLGSVLPDLRAAYALDYQIAVRCCPRSRSAISASACCPVWLPSNGDSNARTSSCIMYLRSALSCC